MVRTRFTKDPIENTEYQIENQSVKWKTTCSPFHPEFVKGCFFTTTPNAFRQRTMTPLIIRSALLEGLIEKLT